MCHKHTKINLSNAINFVTGNNGSGKSAILTALAICLGGRASITQRASTLSSLIREGAESASVKVKLCNSGDYNAFHQSKYGNSIIIERRFGRQAGYNRYVTYNDAGKIVSERREEVIQICDHFCIQVDNPLAVLSQETAKKFLANAKPKELFEFFMKATQLDQLAYDYMFSMDRINMSSSRIESIRDTWCGKEKKIKELEAVYHDLMRQKEIRKGIKEIKSQLAWSVVEAKEKEIEQKETEKLGKQTKLSKLLQNKHQITVHFSIYLYTYFVGAL